MKILENCLNKNNVSLAFLHTLNLFYEIGTHDNQGMLKKFKNTFILGFLCLELIKTGNIVICFCALLLVYENKRVNFKGRQY